MLRCGKSCLAYYEREGRLAGFDFYSGLLAGCAGLLLRFDGGGHGQSFVFGQADQPGLVRQDLAGQLGWIDALIERFEFVELGLG